MQVPHLLVPSDAPPDSRRSMSPFSARNAWSQSPSYMSNVTSPVCGFAPWEKTALAALFWVGAVPLAGVLLALSPLVIETKGRALA